MLGHCEIIKQLMYIDYLNVPIAIMFYFTKVQPNATIF